MMYIPVLCHLPPSVFKKWWLLVLVCGRNDRKPSPSAHQGSGVLLNSLDTTAHSSFQPTSQMRTGHTQGLRWSAQWFSLLLVW